jgi:PAS domain S-box-containing protein
MDSVSEKSKVLIVDDNPHNLYSFQTILGAPELETLTAASGEEALRLLLEHPDTSLILMDVQMPGMDGFETTELIRGQTRFQNIPILFITAVYRGDEFARRGFEVGASDYINKPVDGSLLASKVNVFLTLENQKKQLAREIAERQRVEAELKHLNAALRAIRGLNQLIIQEEEPDRLIQAICEGLIETRGYLSAWIALTDADGGPALRRPPSQSRGADEGEVEGSMMTAQAGLGEAFTPLGELLKHGELPPCGRRALEQFGVVVTEDPTSICTDCPLAAAYYGRARMTARLEHGGTVYGLLAVSLPSGIAVDEEEQALFVEIAGDIAFALYNMELKEERKRTEEALRVSEERFALAVQGSDAGLWDWDIQNNSLYWSPRLKELLGYADDELEVDFDTFDSHLHPDDRERMGAAIEAHLKDGGLYDMEQRLRTKSGEYRWFRARGQALWDEAGNPLRMVGSTTNITEHKQLEEQFLQAQKMEAVGRLTGGIAHDFNNLLTAIIGFSEILLHRQLDEGDPLYKPIEEIHKAGQRAASLTRQLLAFSRKQVLQPKVLDLNAVVTDMDKMLPRVISEDIDLVTVLDPDLGPVKADLGQIEQVIVNLAVNARDAMPQGGQLTIETANVELDEAYARRHVDVQPGPYVMLAVSDTGVGMDKETQSRIFEPFFTTKEEGTGLGLATVYGIVKQSGGHIWVYSEPGQGTTFKIYLPRVEEAVEPLRPSVAPTERLQGSETILVVEDDQGVRMLARDVLEMDGYTVLEASHGEEALRVCEEHQGPIHLMVTDMVMPGMNGRQLAERLAPLRPEMKVLYVSGYTDNAILRHGVLEPGMAFLQKPITPGALARKVREVLDEPDDSEQ